MDAVAEQDLTALEQQLVTYQEKTKEFETITEDKLEEAAIFVGGCKAAEKWIESERIAKVKPLNDEVRTINTAHNTVKNGFEQARTTVERKVSLYRIEQKRLADERQRLELEEAARVQREKEAKLQAERDALAKQEEEARIAQEQADLEETNLDRKIERAERELADLQESAPENMDAAYQRKLQTREERVLMLCAEKAALAPVVVDTSAADATREEIARLEAEVAVPVVAQVVEQTPKTIKTGAGSVSFKDSKMTWILVGWDQKVKKCSLDLVDKTVLATLPEEIRWLLKVSILDVPALNASYKNKEAFPHPFGEVPVFGGSQVNAGSACRRAGTVRSESANQPSARWAGRRDPRPVEGGPPSGAGDQRQLFKP